MDERMIKQIENIESKHVGRRCYLGIRIEKDNYIVYFDTLQQALKNKEASAILNSCECHWKFATTYSSYCGFKGRSKVIEIKCTEPLPKSIGELPIKWNKRLREKYRKYTQ